jgi:hypothetical protein
MLWDVAIGSIGHAGDLDILLNRNARRIGKFEYLPERPTEVPTEVVCSSPRWCFSRSRQISRPRIQRNAVRKKADRASREISIDTISFLPYP